MSRPVVGGVLLLLGSVAIAAIPVAPAAPEVNAEAREAVRAAFLSPAALRQTTLPVDGLAIGPRLWAASVATRKQFTKETKNTYAIVASPEIMAKWKLSPLDLTTVADPTLRSLLAEGSKGGTPVLAGAIMTRGDVIVPALVLDQVKPSDFPFSVRTPTESELQYYYALIPYELSEPILVVEGGGHAFLCHFAKDTKLFYFELL